MREIGDTLIIDINDKIESDIIPISQENLRRVIIVKPGAKVKGSIVGGRVEIYPGCSITGGILASEVVFNLERGALQELGERPLVKINGDITSLSMITFSEADLEMVPRELLIYVTGNLIAPHMIRMANTIVEGNIISSKVELRNVIGLGILGLVEFRQRSTHHAEERGVSKVFNSILFTILSEMDINVSEELGILVPLVYFSQNARAMGDGHIVLTRVSPLLEILREYVSISTERDKEELVLGKFIKEYLGKNYLCRLPPESLKSLIGLITIEAAPLMKKKREEVLVEALTNLIYKGIVY